MLVKSELPTGWVPVAIQSAAPRVAMSNFFIWLPSKVISEAALQRQSPCAH
jgi:hypothetical protein